MNWKTFISGAVGLLVTITFGFMAFGIGYLWGAIVFNFDCGARTYKI